MNDYGIPPRLTTAQDAPSEPPTDVMSIVATSYVPVARWNTKHACTQRDGWRASETTAELTFYPGITSPEEARAMLAELQQVAYDVSQEEAIRRNQEGHLEPVE